MKNKVSTVKELNQEINQEFASRLLALKQFLEGKHPTTTFSWMEDDFGQLGILGQHTLVIVWEDNLYNYDVWIDIDEHFKNILFHNPMIISKKTFKEVELKFHPHDDKVFDSICEWLDINKLK